MKRKKVKTFFLSLIPGAIGVLLALAFALSAVFVSIGNDSVDVGFIAFIFVCAAIAGTFPIIFNAVKRSEDAAKIAEAIDKVRDGEYCIDMPEVGVEFESVKETVERLSSIFAAADKAQLDFVNDFSHELKTPIVSIRGFAKLLTRDDLTDEERKEYSTIIAEQSERLIKLTAQTLMLDKLGSGDKQFEKSWFSLSESVEKCIVAMQTQWETKNLDMVIDIDDASVESNSDLVEQMITNLLENAVKYTPEGKKVSVSVKKEGDKVVVTVADEGVGMDEETKARAFERYYRGDSSRTTPGNGLGLATVKKIAETLDVKIQLESILDQGTEFKLIFD